MGIRTDVPSASTPDAAPLTPAAPFSPTPEPAAAPAGGIGILPGAYDSLSNRDLMITCVNETRTRVAELVAQVTNLKARVDDLEARLGEANGYGLIP